MATFNTDFRDLLAEFNAHGVEYLVVGAHALAAHGQIRATVVRAGRASEPSVSSCR